MDLDIDLLVERNGLTLPSLRRLYLSLGVRFGTSLPRWTGLFGEGSERHGTNRSGELNQWLTRLALSALTHRRFVLPRTGEQLKATSFFDCEFGAEVESIGMVSGD
jgi:hypothetical protein